MQQIQQAFAQPPLAKLASQYGGNHPLARWQWRRLMHQTNARAQALALAAGQLPGLLTEHLNFAATRLQGSGQQVEQARLAGP